MLNALWTNVVSNKQCQTCIEVKLPISASSCETRLWKFSQVFILVLKDKLFGHEVMLALSAIYSNFWLIIPLMLNIFSTNIWLSSRLLIMGLTRSKEWDPSERFAWWPCFEFTMFFLKDDNTTNNEAIMKDKSLVNLITWLWVKFSSFAIFKH